MEAIIKKNSTQTLIVDPRHYGDPNVDWDSVLQNSVVSFSLFDVETGCFIIANRPGSIIPGGLAVTDAALSNSVACGDNTSVSRIAYNFRSRDTKSSGVYRGTFQVNNITDLSVLAVPSLGDIQIIIAESAVSPLNQGSYTGMPAILDAPITGATSNGGSNNGLIAHTWADLNALRVNGTLIPGQEYLLIDYQTIHRVPLSEYMNIGPIEPLIIRAVTANSFSRTVISQLYPNDTIHYDFLNQYVACEDSFDTDIDGAGSICVNDTSNQRPGYIAFRFDTVLQLSTYYDFRSFVNQVNAVTGLTFGATVSNSHIGQLSGNIILTEGNGYRIGENSTNLYLTKIADRVTIGNDVRLFSTSGASINSRVFPGSTFELGNGGTDGTIRTTINMGIDSLGFEGTTYIGLVPKGSVISSIELVGTALPTTGQISMGINGISENEVFGPIAISGISSNVFSATVSTKAPAENTELTIKLLGSDVGSGRVFVKANFANTGSGLGLGARIPNTVITVSSGDVTSATYFLQADTIANIARFTPLVGTMINDYELSIVVSPAVAVPLPVPAAPKYGAVDEIKGEFSFSMLPGTSFNDYEIEIDPTI